MIKRELYISRIRPFIGSDLIKVMTGIRRCGKSVMLELVKQELTESGVNPSQFISINFEDMRYSHLQTAKALHDEVTARAAKMDGKVYIFFDEIQEVKDWEKCVNSLRVSLDCDIYITGSNAKLLSGELATYLGGRYVEFVIYPSHSQNFWSCTARLRRMSRCREPSRSTFCPVVCPILPTSALPMSLPNSISMTYSTRYSSRTL